MARKGEELVCQNCGKTVISNSSRQKYCTECYYEVASAKRRLLYERQRNGDCIKLGEDFTCVVCGRASPRRSPQQKVCADCRVVYNRMKASERDRNKRKAAREEKAAKKEEEVVVVVDSKKDDYRLAEVEAAARKNNMNYGRYVAEWKQGKVPAPEHIKTPKKRGRKKKHEEER